MRSKIERAIGYAIYQQSREKERERELEPRKIKPRIKLIKVSMMIEDGKSRAFHRITFRMADWIHA